MRIYRVDYTTPVGGQPDRFFREADGAPYSERPDWGWPRRRLYFTRAAAETRAALLRDLGALDVSVVESAPVEFPTGVTS